MHAKNSVHPNGRKIEKDKSQTRVGWNKHKQKFWTNPKACCNQAHSLSATPNNRQNWNHLPFNPSDVTMRRWSPSACSTAAALYSFVQWEFMFPAANQIFDAQTHRAQKQQGKTFLLLYWVLLTLMLMMVAVASLQSLLVLKVCTLFSATISDYHGQYRTLVGCITHTQQSSSRTPTTQLI